MTYDLGNAIIAREMVALAIGKTRDLFAGHATQQAPRLRVIIEQLDAALIELDALIAAYDVKQRRH
jgi:hypothetical protein